MSSPKNSESLTPLSDSMLLAFDRYCDRFEEALQNPTPVDLREFLDTSPEEVRDKLFGELLLLELTYRVPLDVSMARAEYHRRFPEYAAIIDRVMEEAITKCESGQSASDISLATAPEGEADHYRNAFDAKAPVIPGYEIECQIGRGAMGVVYRGRQRRLNRVVAIKTMRGPAADDPKMVVRFLAEAEATAAIDHPHVARVYDFGEAGGQPYMVLEYCPGGTLAGRLKAAPDRQLPLKVAAELLAKIARGVAAAHDQGIVHRDLKPGNILFDETGQPKVADFGLAKVGAGSDLTQTQAIIGTPAYMAPEQASGKAKLAGPPADVWALGVILYECLTGERPFKADDPTHLMRRIVEEAPTPPRQWSSSIPRDLELICLKCLRKETRDRYPNAKDLADDLQRYLCGETITARAAGRLERTAAWARRKPAAAAAYSLGGIAGVLLLFTLTIAYFWRDAESSRKRAEFESEQAEGARIVADDLRVQEASSRVAAEQARDREVIAREAEEKAKKEAVEARDKLKVVEYGRTMQVALDLWRDNDVRGALDLINSTDPALRGWEWDYLNRLCNSELLSCQTAVPEYLSQVAINEEGTLILGLVAAHTICVWDAITGKERFRIGTVTQRSRFRAARFLQNDIVSVSASGDIEVWDGRTGKVRLTNESEEDFYSACVSINGQFAALISKEGSLRVWKSTPDKAPTPSHQAETRSARAIPICLDERGQLVLLTNANGSASVWDVQARKEVCKLQGVSQTSHRIRSATFDSTGTRIATASLDGTARVWDAKTGQLTAVLTDHGLGAHSVAFGFDNRMLAVTSGAGSIRVYRTREWSVLVEYHGQGRGAGCAVFSSDGHRLITGHNDGTARTWSTVERRGPDPMHIRSMESFHVNENSSRLITRHRSGLKSWNAADWNSHADIIHAMKLRAIGYVVDSTGERVAVHFEDSSGAVFDAATGKQQFSLGGPEAGIVALPSSSFSNSLAVGYRNGTIRIRNAVDGKVERELQTRHSDMTRLDMSPDGSQIAIARGDQNVRIIDSRTGDEIRHIQIPRERFLPTVAHIRYLANGTVIATISNDYIVRLWDVTTGSERTAMKGHTQRVASVDLSPDGRRVVTASVDGTVRIWDARTGAQLLALRHDSQVYNARFHPDGFQILSGGVGKLRVWDTRPMMAEK